ncbi:MAG: pilus assembly protein [Planctomycetaceae bacterium]|nr:pilus assembly protein [Planctomycetaceae bacterium]
MRNSHSPSRNRKRHGVVALEFLLLFPLLMILLLAVIEFGLILAAAKHVEFASRLGAKLAAESNSLDTLNNPGTTDNLKQQIDQYLNTAGYTDSCVVLLEHNVSGVGGTSQSNPLVAPSNCPCSPVGSLPSSAGSPSTTVESVRVTVCLPMTGNVPNCLDTFGFSITDRVIRQSVVWNYEQP